MASGLERDLKDQLVPASQLGDLLGTALHIKPSCRAFRAGGVLLTCCGVPTLGHLMVGHPTVGTAELPTVGAVHSFPHCMLNSVNGFSH